TIGEDKDRAGTGQGILELTGQHLGTSVSSQAPEYMGLVADGLNLILLGSEIPVQALLGAVGFHLTRYFMALFRRRHDRQKIHGEHIDYTGRYHAQCWRQRNRPQATTPFGHRLL